MPSPEEIEQWLVQERIEFPEEKYPGLTDKEARVMWATHEVMDAIRDLYGSAPANFVNEAIPAIHTLQMFALMHYAHRQNPSYWSDWTHPE